MSHYFSHTNDMTRFGPVESEDCLTMDIYRFEFQVLLLPLVSKRIFERLISDHRMQRISRLQFSFMVADFQMDLDLAI